MALEPQLIVRDEAVSALDVATKVQVVNLIIGFQTELNFPFSFISHDVAFVE